MKKAKKLVSNNIHANNENLLTPCCVIVSTNIAEKGVVIQKQIEDMINNDEEIYFLLYKQNLTNLTIGNTLKTISKINNGKLHTEKQPKMILEHKYKELITITGLLIKNITDNLALNVSNCKFLENTKKILHIDCPTIKKRQNNHLNYVLSSTATQNKLNNTQLLFYIISFWYESKLFLNDTKEILHTNSVANFITKPTTTLDFISLLKIIKNKNIIKILFLLIILFVPGPVGVVPGTGVVPVVPVPVVPQPFTGSFGHNFNLVPQQSYKQPKFGTISQKYLEIHKTLIKEPKMLSSTIPTMPTITQIVSKQNTYTDTIKKETIKENSFLKNSTYLNNSPVIITPQPVPKTLHFTDVLNILKKEEVKKNTELTKEEKNDILNVHLVGTPLTPVILEAVELIETYKKYYIFGFWDKSFYCQNSKGILIPYDKMHPGLSCLDSSKVIMLSHANDARAKNSDRSIILGKSVYTENKLEYKSVNANFVFCNPFDANIIKITITIIIH